MGYNTLSTETWSLRIPEDWTEKKTADDGQVYFESPDGTKGLYITTWRFSLDEHGRSNASALEHVGKIEKRSLQEMEGYSWQLMSEERFSANGIETVIIDHYAKENAYRIACKVIASLPWVVRSTLHDYDCQDWAASREELREILHSIAMHK